METSVFQYSLTDIYEVTDGRKIVYLFTFCIFNPVLPW